VSPLPPLGSFGPYSALMFAFYEGFKDGARRPGRTPRTPEAERRGGGEGKGGTLAAGYLGDRRGVSDRTATRIAIPSPSKTGQC